MSAQRGIATTYAGTRFRSRLEARWANFFDLLGWPWEYEPIDLDGYIPDFVLPFPAGPLLVEAKPEFSLQALRGHVGKVERSGWEGEALVVGAMLFEPVHFVDMPSAGLLSQRTGHDRGEWCWEPGDLIGCDSCGKPSIYPPYSAWECYRCGAGGKVYLGEPPDFLRLWKEAGNRTQWRPRRPR